MSTKPYAKFLNETMEPLRAVVREAMEKGPVDPKLAFPPEEAMQLLEPGYLPLENGFTRLPNGQMFIASLTPMPGVSGKMIDWWFGWHAAETERYQLWFPNAHMGSSSEKPLSDVQGLSDRGKYIGNTSYAKEYVGKKYNEIVIAFKDPAEYGFDESKFAAAKVSTVICARLGQDGTPLLFGSFIHLVRETDNGCEMRSRFWLGDLQFKIYERNHWLNKLLPAKLLARVLITNQTGKDMLEHSSLEMTHLAGFLPRLYRLYNPGN